MSKLGFHVSAGNRRGLGECLLHCTEAGSPVPVLFSLDQDLWPDVQKYSPSTVLIFRTQASLYHKDIGDGPGSLYHGDPVQTARDWLTLLLPVWALNRAHYYAPLNEQDPPDVAGFKWLNDFTIECMRLAEANGYLLGLYAFSAGNPKNLTGPQGKITTTWKQCVTELIPSLRAAEANGHILLLHEYGLDKGTLQASAPFLALRYRDLYDFLPIDARPHLVISEASAGSGYAGISEGAWLKDVRWYDAELMKDRQVIGCGLYQLGGDENFVALLPSLADYIAATPTPPLPQTAPLPPLVTTIENCARCGLTHIDLAFKKFVHPVTDGSTLWGYWALCPASGDPILLRSVEREAVP